MGVLRSSPPLTRHQPLLTADQVAEVGLSIYTATSKGSSVNAALPKETNCQPHIAQNTEPDISLTYQQPPYFCAKCFPDKISHPGQQPHLSDRLLQPCFCNALSRYGANWVAFLSISCAGLIPHFPAKIDKRRHERTVEHVEASFPLSNNKTFRGHYPFPCDELLVIPLFDKCCPSSEMDSPSKNPAWIISENVLFQPTILENLLLVWNC